VSTAVTTAPAGADRLPAGGATFPNVLRSEWTKIRSLRSTWLTLLAALVVTLGLSLLIDWAIVANWDQAPADQKATFDATNNAFNGVSLGQLATAVFGVLAVTSEYSTGGIRTTFIAVPRRLRVLGAKALLVAVLGLVVALVTAFLCFLIGQQIFASQGISTTLGAHGVLRAVVGAGLYIAGCGMFGLAVGTVVRSTPGSVTTVVALLFVLPLLTLAIPGDLGHHVREYFTANAGVAITYTTKQPATLGPWAGYAVFTVEWLVILLAGALLLRRRDV
jgi:ABC-type transport system involved in multi-copper enzyme maturation permease subunit